MPSPMEPDTWDYWMGQRNSIRNSSLELNCTLPDSRLCSEVGIPELIELYSKTTVASVITWLIVLGNIVNLVILPRMKSVNSRVKALMASMSASDLLLGIFVCIPSMIAAILEFWPFSYVFCQITGIINGMSISVSMWSLTGISVERFLVIVQPLQFNHQPRLRHIRMGIAFIWVFNIVYYITPICLRSDMQYYVYQPDMLVCGFIWEPDWILYLAGVLYPIGPGMIIVGCSYKIMMVIRHSNLRIMNVVSGEPRSAIALHIDNPTFQADGDEGSQEILGLPTKEKAVSKGTKQKKPRFHVSAIRRATIRREAKVSKVMVITAMAFFSCSFPYLCTAVAEKQHAPITSWHAFGVMWLLNCNSFINVFIYSSTYAEFRQLFRLIFLPCCSTDNRKTSTRTVQ